MSYIVNGQKVKKIGVLTEPNSYQTDITPAEMQKGKTCVSKGKVLTGTGKAFEFAHYGLKKVQPDIEIDGEEKYGIQFETPPGTNLVLISVSKGDSITQSAHLVELTEGESVEIGHNVTTGGGIFIRQDGTLLKIYFASLQDGGTRLRYFYGKDNEV